MNLFNPFITAHSLTGFSAAEEVAEQGLGEDEEGERVCVRGRGRRTQIKIHSGRGNLLSRLPLSQGTSQIKISLNVNANF